MLYMVLVDGMYVTSQSHMISGGHYPVLETENVKYAKLFQTKNGAVACLNKLNKVWPDRLINVREVELQLGKYIKSN